VLLSYSPLLAPIQYSLACTDTICLATNAKRLPALAGMYLTHIYRNTGLYRLINTGKHKHRHTDVYRYKRRHTTTKTQIYSHYILPLLIRKEIRKAGRTKEERYTQKVNPGAIESLFIIILMDN
jgi:hypothetical protein